MLIVKSACLGATTWQRSAETENNSCAFPVSDRRRCEAQLPPCTAPPLTQSAGKPAGRTDRQGDKASYTPPKPLTGVKPLKTFSHHTAGLRLLPYRPRDKASYTPTNPLTGVKALKTTGPVAHSSPDCDLTDHRLHWGGRVEGGGG